MAKFWTIIYIFLSYWLVSLILVIIFPSTAVMLWMVFIFAWILSIVLRMRLIAVDNINEENQFRECCIGFWCPPCSIAQSKLISSHSLHLLSDYMVFILITHVCTLLAIFKWLDISMGIRSDLMVMVILKDLITTEATMTWKWPKRTIIHC